MAASIKGKPADGDPDSKDPLSTWMLFIGQPDGQQVCVCAFVLGHMLLNPYRIITLSLRPATGHMNCETAIGVDDVWRIAWNPCSQPWPFALLPTLLDSFNFVWCNVRLLFQQLQFTLTDWDELRIDGFLETTQVWPTPKKKTTKVSHSSFMIHNFHQSFELLHRYACFCFHYGRYCQCFVISLLIAT